MLQITIPESEPWDESKGEFVYTKEQTLCLEHSLVSLSKWESKWNKAFLSKKEKTQEETIDYIRCMTLTKNVDPKVYGRLTSAQFNTIHEYINAPMTATYFSEDKNGKTSREVITAEIIYHWMISLQIPFECQKWHLNRLITLIRVCSIKNAPPKKMGKRATASNYAAMNAARRQQFNTRG